MKILEQKKEPAMKSLKRELTVVGIILLALSTASPLFAKIGWDLKDFAEDKAEGQAVTHLFTFERGLQISAGESRWAVVEGTAEIVEHLNAGEVDEQINTVDKALLERLNSLEEGVYRLVTTVYVENSATGKKEKLLEIKPTFEIKAGEVTNERVENEDVFWFDTFYYTEAATGEKKTAETKTATMHTVPRIPCEERAAAIEAAQAKIEEFAEKKDDEVAKKIVAAKQKEIESYQLMDTDGDGAGYQQEKDAGTRDCPTNGSNSQDFDSDGLVDGLELSLKTSPTNPDSDGDGIADGMEKNGFSIKGIDDLVQTDPTLPDTDGDGLSDGQERDGINIPVNGKQRLVHSNPAKGKIDSDSDGIPDGREVTVTTISIEGQQVSVFTDPLNKNTDAEGRYKKREIKDSYTDAQELAGLTCKIDPTGKKKFVLNPAKTDSDDDGLSDSEECSVTGSGTDPTQKDSDLDGLTDGDEV
jgi:hypothetical protein